MKQMKIMAVTLAALVTMGGLSACNKSGMNQGSESESTQPGMSQEQQQPMGKSYVQQIPPEETQQKEMGVTPEGSPENAPATGNEPVKPEQQQTKQEPKPMDNP